MADNFEDNPVVTEQREKLWPLIRNTPWLDWQLLTKRADRIAECLPSDWGKGYPNVWLGVSIEMQDYLWRAEILSKIPAKVRFISYEPALGPLDLTRYFGYKNSNGKEKNEYRRLCLRCGYQWQIDNRSAGSGLAQIEKWGDASSRTHCSTRISSGSVNDPRSAIPHGGSSAGVQALQGPNTEGSSNQPQERSALGQSTRKSRAGNGEPKSERPSHLRSKGYAESPVQADRCPGCGNPKTEVCRGESFLDRRSVWRKLPARFQAGKGATPLISWTVYGGESGPNFRPHDLAWPRSMLRQCRKKGVAFFYKQGSHRFTERDTDLDGVTIQEYPTAAAARTPRSAGLFDRLG